MHCIALRHLAFEDLGVLAPVLHEQGASIEYWDGGRCAYDDRAWLEADLAVVLGGPVGVGDEARYPFLRDELRLVKARLDAGLPLLGICLGAQLMAAARGARVYAGARKEIGWGTVTLTPEGREGVLAPLLDAPVLHWHGDTFDLPEGARLLASSELTPHQAFALGFGQLALQFHVEADAAHMEDWLVGHCCELAGAAIDPCVIRDDARLLGAQAAAAGQEVCRRWLKEARRCRAQC